MWKVSKNIAPYILGLFFGFVLSIFTEEGKKANSVWDFWTFCNSLKLIFPFMIMAMTVAIFTDVTAFGYQKTKEKISSKVSAFRRERISSFEPVVFQNKNITLLEFACAKGSFLYCAITYSINHRKTKKETIAKTKRELYRNILENDLNRIKPSSWVKFETRKIMSYRKGVFPIFEFDFDNKIFYLFRKEGKPQKFWNEEHYPKLEEISFSFGEYDFEIELSATDIFGRRFVQVHPFSIIYNEENGIEVLQS